MQPLQKCLIWAFGLTLIISSTSGSDNRPVIEEHQGKALLIYNIAKFTVWPSKTDTSNEVFEIALWGNDTLAPALQIIAGQQTHGRTVRIHRYAKSQFPADSDVLIIPGHSLQKFIKARNTFKTLPILTVTTDPKVFDAGAMVLIEVIDDHLSFSVNLERVKSSGLEISGNLLRHAKEVNF